MIPNRYRRPDHRAAFELALELLRQGLDFLAVSKQLDHGIPREKRKAIAAKAARLLREAQK